MAAQLFTLPKQIAISSSFAALPGAKLYFYRSGTTTPENTFADADLGAANTNPVVADSAGFFSSIYLDPSVSYKCEFRTSADLLIYTTDPCNSAVQSAGQVNVATSVAGTNTIVAALVPSIDVYTPQMVVVLTPVNTTTGAVTFDLGPGPLEVTNIDGRACVGGELVAGLPALLVLDAGGDDWVIQNTGRVRANVTNVAVPATTDISSNGKIIVLGAGGANTTTIGVSVADGILTLINNTGGANTINVSSGTLFWFNGSGTVGTGARTFATSGVATVLSLAGNAFIYGTGIS